MWKNIVQPDRPQTIIYYYACALHAGGLSYKHTLIICNTSGFSTATMTPRTRPSVRLIRKFPVLFLRHYNPVRDDVLRATLFVKDAISFGRRVPTFQSNIMPPPSG